MATHFSPRKTSKQEARTRAREVRAGLPILESRPAALLLSAPEVKSAITIAAYWSLPHEPDTHELLNFLRGEVRILLPIVLADWNLDWAEWNGEELVSKKGLWEPSGPRLGIAAISEANVIITPGLGGDARGARLGQGGGCYDRAFKLAGITPWRVMLLHDEEFSTTNLFEDEHDERVDAIATPTRLIRIP